MFHALCFNPVTDANVSACARRCLFNLQDTPRLFLSREQSQFVTLKQVRAFFSRRINDTYPARIRALYRHLELIRAVARHVFLGYDCPFQSHQPCPNAINRPAANRAVGKRQENRLLSTLRPQWCLRKCYRLELAALREQLRAPATYLAGRAGEAVVVQGERYDRQLPHVGGKSSQYIILSIIYYTNDALRLFRSARAQADLKHCVGSQYGSIQYSDVAVVNRPANCRKQKLVSTHILDIYAFYLLLMQNSLDVASLLTQVPCKGRGQEGRKGVDRASVPPHVQTNAFSSVLANEVAVDSPRGLYRQLQTKSVSRQQAAIEMKLGRNLEQGCPAAVRVPQEATRKKPI